MRLALVTDAWEPQVNGVVTTLVALVDGLRADGHTVEVLHPGLFATRPCPGYPGIDLAVRPGRELTRRLLALQPDAVHIATEGPLGWAARRHCRRHGLAFTTAFHTRFPEIIHAATRMPVSWGYAVLRHFHRPSSGVMLPTEGMLRLLQQRGFGQLRSWTHGVDTTTFTYQAQPLRLPELAHLPRPLSLYVGRVSYEKNIEAFLSLPVAGSKVVCGVGPLRETLQARYPAAHWIGVLPREALARVYAAADVFVFPSRADTFGLVMLEAMATGTPVAAFPVEGPQEVIGPPGPGAGGALHEDLAEAWHRARRLPRHDARTRALAFSWPEATRRFLGHLVPAHPGAVL